MSAAPAPAAEAAPQPIHTLSLFVNNKPGVLVRVALTFSRRGFNIESLVVSPGAEGRSRGSGKPESLIGQPNMGTRPARGSSISTTM